MFIKVRAKEGRVVKTKPVGGKRITNDAEGELVERNDWIDRAITVHGDLEIVKPAAKADAKAETK